jgi:hypothetical protein
MQGGRGADTFWWHGGHYRDPGVVRDFRPITDRDRIIAEGEADVIRFIASEQARDTRDGTGWVFEVDFVEFRFNSSSAAVDDQWFEVIVKDDNRIEYGGRGEEPTRALAIEEAFDDRGWML